MSSAALLPQVGQSGDPALIVTLSHVLSGTSCQ